MRALEVAGYDVSLATEFRSWEGNGEASCQQQVRLQAEEIAAGLIAQYRALPANERPRAWFTYHLYHKAPDWVGPIVSKALDIPYFIAEASIAGKQADGNWQQGYYSTIAAVQHAAAIFSINPADVEGINTAIDTQTQIVPITPFLESLPPPEMNKHNLRQELATTFKVSADRYWLLTVAMMRNDSKLDSYAQLAKAMAALQRKDWTLFIIGDGPADLLVKEHFRFDFDRQIYFLGKRDQQMIYDLMRASDLFVWPAINEALGMVALEALANGLPCLCGNAGGIGQIISQNKTGILIDHPASPDAIAKFTSAMEDLMENPGRLADMSTASIEKFRKDHLIYSAASVLQTTISGHLG